MAPSRTSATAGPAIAGSASFIWGYPCVRRRRHVDRADRDGGPGRRPTPGRSRSCLPRAGVHGSRRRPRRLVDALAGTWTLGMGSARSSASRSSAARTAPDGSNPSAMRSGLCRLRGRSTALRDCRRCLEGRGGNPYAVPKRRYRISASRREVAAPRAQRTAAGLPGTVRLAEGRRSPSGDTSGGLGCRHLASRAA